jgi:DNA-binding LytR/AlgR family response regulator
LLIVEDDKNILEFCANALHSLSNDIHILSATNAKDALSILSDNMIDGAFIDIGLVGETNGFSLARKIRRIEKYQLLPIIFETAENKDLPETYKQYHNFDYISKPYTRETFLEISARFLNEIEAHKKLLHPKKESKIAFYHDGGWLSIPFSDILYATTSIRKIKIVMRNKVFFRSATTLSNIITEIGEKMFVQCHKAYAVNVENVEKIEQVSHKTWNIYFKNTDVDPCQLSQRYKKVVDGLIQEKEILSK